MTRASWVRSGLFWACAACGGPETLPATQVVVLVGGESDIALLDVRVYDEAGQTLSSKRSIDLTVRAPFRLPTSFSIVPQGRSEARFRVIVQGFSRAASGQTRALARAELVAAFTGQQTSLLPITLSAACASVSCGCGVEPCAESCDALRGQCAPIARYDALPSIEPGSELDAHRRGLGGCVAGSFVQPDGSCRDIDECAFEHTCSRDPSACVNLPAEAGRYECKCPPGYAGKGEEDDPCVR